MYSGLTRGPISMFGLLFIDNATNSPNIRGGGADELLRIYVKNAQTLSKSLKINGRISSFTLLTNNMERISEYLGDDTLQLEQLHFARELPEGSRFYAAHHKLDIFRFLSEIDAQTVGLCDLDMYCLRPLPEAALTVLANGIPIVYDITEQVEPAYGVETIRSDLATVSGSVGLTRWFGGEFICGAPAFFRELSNAVEQIYPRYLRAINQVHHVGDEMVTSCALGVMIDSGLVVADARDLGVVARYWNSKTRHRQSPFSAYQHCAMLHLPADKRFLAALADHEPSDAQDFLRRYRGHRVRGGLRRAVVGLVQRVRR